MLKSYRYIITLICIAVIGIAGFQIYWLSNNYELEKSKLSTSINASLVDAFEQTLVNRGRFMFETISPGAQIEFTISDSSHLLNFPSHNLDSAFIDRRQALIKISDQPSDTDVFHSRQVHAERIDIVSDSIFHVDYDAVFNKIIGVFDADSTSLFLIDSFYRIELAARSINSDFCLNRYQNGEVIESTYDEPLVDGFSSRTITEFPSNDVKLAAIFPKFSNLLFQRMSLTIMSSFLLLAFTIFCFVYILRTLFHQKKMADVRRDFVSNMTHEFKTPISIISAVNEALTNFDILGDKEKTNEYLTISQTEVQRLSGMVEKVLDMAAYEKDDFKLEMTELNLHDMIKDVKSQFNARNDKRLNIDFVDNSQNPIIHADESHMTNVIYNLLDNAVKYSTDNKEIDIMLDEDDSQYSIAIQDHGIGIPKNQREKIFDKFYRVSTGNRHDVKGFGLGLSYVKKIVELHQGDIQVNSIEGEGSTFTIRLSKNGQN